MRLRSAAVFCLLLLMLSALPLYAAQPIRCGTKQLSDNEIASLEREVTRGKKGKTSSVIPVWVHVISGGPGYELGEVPDSMIRAQIRVLSESFNGKSGGVNTAFGFDLVGITRTEDPRWFSLFASDFNVELEAKTELRRGGPGTLNLYLTNADPYLGWAYFPAILNTQYANLDGVVVDWRSLPGGTFQIYSEGDTAPHEVGHWLALYHTFEGQCSKNNDYVADTPAEHSPAFFCPVGRDSCPGNGNPGLDPITNFMDYTQDSCMYEFTTGQAERMQAAWAAFRD